MSGLRCGPGRIPRG